MKTVLIALLVLMPLVAQVDAYRGGERGGYRPPQREEMNRPPQYSREESGATRAYNPNEARNAAGAAGYREGAAAGSAAGQGGTQVIVTPPPQQPINPAPYPQ